MLYVTAARQIGAAIAVLGEEWSWRLAAALALVAAAIMCLAVEAWSQAKAKVVHQVQN